MGMKNSKLYAKHKLGDRVKYVTDTCLCPKKPCNGGCGAKQEFRKETDINVIVDRYVKAGVPLPSPEAVSNFMDCTQIPNYQQMLDKVNSAAASFLKLPPKVRERFGNEPARLIEFLQDESNREEAVFLGLIEKKVETTPTASQAKDKPEAEPLPKVAPKAEPQK